MGMYDDFPKEITNKYYALWNNGSESLMGGQYPLKRLFCLPDIVDQYGFIVDINKAFTDIASGKKLVIAIKGIAGSGKTSLIAYLCNNSDILDINTGIMIWTLPKSTFLIGIIMGECSTYAKKFKKKRMILVLENTMGLEINLEEIYKTISQRQETLYPHISVIITYRSNDDFSSCNQCEILNIKPFSEEKIWLFIKKYVSLNKEFNYSYETIISQIDKFSIDTIGNPAILSLLLKTCHKNIRISTAEDIFSSLISTGIAKKASDLLETIACLMFTKQADYISEEDLYNYLNRVEKVHHNNAFDIKDINSIKASLKGICVFKDKEISFVHKSLYEYSLAGYLANILYKLSNNEQNKQGNNAICQLYSLFIAGKLNPRTITFLESKIKNNDIVPLHILVKQIKYFFSMYLGGDLISHNGEYMHNNQSSFLRLFQIEMTLFFNFCMLYCSGLRAIGSVRMFEKNDHTKEAFMNYLKLFSSFGHEVRLDLSGLDFSEYDFSNISLNGIDFSSCELMKCSFTNSKLENIIFKQANFNE